ncbi:MAG: hypothetical protein U5K72_15405 [Balneolaceae bacterium]|nr:hypothetical protein [Balneolaceae bacterium]
MKNLSKIVLISSAIINAILGIAITFLPQETGQFIGTTEMNTADLALMQILGSALIGIAIINYMSRGITIGGIYGKPLLLGNLVFHLATGLGLIKYVFSAESWILFGLPALLYLILTAGFIKLNFTSPV